MNDLMNDYLNVFGKYPPISGLSGAEAEDMIAEALATGKKLPDFHDGDENIETEPQREQTT